jgi:hypothetical protein
MKPIGRVIVTAIVLVFLFITFEFVQTERTLDQWEAESKKPCPVATGFDEDGNLYCVKDGKWVPLHRRGALFTSEPPPKDRP